MSLLVFFVARRGLVGVTQAWLRSLETSSAFNLQKNQNGSVLTYFSDSQQTQLNPWKTSNQGSKLMTAKKDFTVTPEQLTPALVGPITVSLHKPLLDDLNTYRQIDRFLTEFPQGTPSLPLKTLLDTQLGAIKGIALFLKGLAEIEAGRVTDCQEALQSVSTGTEPK
ncbi:hypothetical protein ACW9I9_18695 [Pseudomonas pergaminensis]